MSKKEGEKIGKSEGQKVRRTEGQKDRKTDRQKGERRLLDLLIFVFLFVCFFLNVITSEKSFAQGKNPKLQSSDTLPPDPKFSFCPHGANAHRKDYVFDRPDNASIRSNLFSISIDKKISYNFELSYGEFEPCYDSFIDWKAVIIDNKEDAFAAITFSDCAGNDTILYLSYFATKIDITPKSQDYGFHSVGDTVDKKYYIKNLSQTSSVGIKYLELKRKEMNGSPQGFTLWDSTGTNPLPTEFKPGISINSLDSFPFIIRFIATEEGEFWDSIGIGDSCAFDYIAYVYALVEPMIGITDNKFNNSEVEIYPNPASEYIDINVVGVQNFEPLLHNIQIYNILGECVLKCRHQASFDKLRMTDGRQQRIDVSGLVEGIYFIQIFTNKFSFRQNFIKLE